MENFKHGDTVIATVNKETYSGRIEERMMNQWPDSRFSLFVAIEGHFPISVESFLNDYGQLKKQLMK